MGWRSWKSAGRESTVIYSKCFIPLFSLSLSLCLSFFWPPLHNHTSTAHESPDNGGQCWVLSEMMEFTPKCLSSSSRSTNHILRFSCDAETNPTRKPKFTQQAEYSLVVTASQIFTVDPSKISIEVSGTFKIRMNCLRRCTKQWLMIKTYKYYKVSGKWILLRNFIC